MIKEYLAGEYFTKRDKAVQSITEKFDMYYSDNHNDLKELINFINYTDSFIKTLLDKVELIEHSNIELSESSTSMKSVIANYRIDSFFNEDKAKKWFVNALIMIIMQGYEFKPPYFIKGNEKIIKTKILK